MNKIALRLLRDETGFVQSAELVLLVTIAIIGAMVGLASLRDSVVSELDDTGKAIGALNQSYDVSIISGCLACGDEIAFDAGTNTVTVHVKENLKYIQTKVVFKNFKFDDAPDFCEDQVITHPDAGVNETTPAPPTGN